MPTPNVGETQDEFISRCIPIVVSEDGVDQAQASAICNSIWNENKIKGWEDRKAARDRKEKALKNGTIIYK